MIEKETIEAIKSGVDLKSYIESRGITFKKNGKSYLGLCPFHDDTNPSFSVNPSKNLWQCFGCGTGGDVIRFVELIDKVSFPEAVQQLNGEKIHLKSKTGTTDNGPLCKGVQAFEQSCLLLSAHTHPGQQGDQVSKK